MRLGVLLLFALGGCSQERYVRVVVEPPPGDVLLQSLLATVTLEARTESRTMPEDGGGLALPADFVVLLGDASGLLTVSVVATGPGGEPLASGAASLQIPGGGDGRVGGLHVRLAAGGDAGCGDGVFIPGELCLEPQWVPVLGRIGPPALVDVDQDGTDDLVAGTSVDGGRTVSISLGLGGGQYGEPQTPNPVDVGDASPAPLATGDLNEDGQADLVLAGGTDRAPVALLSRAEGGLAPPASLGDGTPGLDPRIGDVDGDGHLDVLCSRDGELWALLGDGAGAFPRTVQLDRVDATTTLALAELDDSPGAEVVVGRTDADGAPAGLAVLAMRDGAFESLAEAPDAPAAHALATADLDGEGARELLVGGDDRLQAYRWGGGALERLFDRSIAPTPGSEDQVFIRSIVPIARPGRTDRIVVLLGGELWADEHQGGVLVELSADSTAPGADALTEVFRENVACADPLGASGDVNRDGRPELLLSCNSGGAAPNGAAVLHVEDGALPLPTRVLPTRAGFTLGDTDADGLPELVALDENHTVILYDDPQLPDLASRSEVVGHPPWDFGGLRIVDLDGDGAGEVAGTCNGCWMDAGLYVWKRAAIGFDLRTASYTLEVGGDQPRAIVGAQLAPDAPLALVAFTENTGVVVWPDPLGSPDSTVVAGIGGGMDAFTLSVALGELDGTPGADVLVTSAGTSLVELFRSDGEGGLAPAEPVDIPVPVAVATVDLDADGQGEVAAVSGDPAVLTILDMGEGPGEQTLAASVPLPSRGRSLSVVDLDGLGAPELVVGTDPLLQVFGLDEGEPRLRRSIPGFREAGPLQSWSVPGQDGAATPPVVWVSARPGWGATDGTWFTFVWTARP